MPSREGFTFRRKTGCFPNMIWENHHPSHRHLSFLVLLCPERDFYSFPQTENNFLRGLLHDPWRGRCRRTGRLQRNRSRSCPNWTTEAAASLWRLCTCEAGLEGEGRREGAIDRSLRSKDLSWCRSGEQLSRRVGPLGGSDRVVLHGIIGVGHGLFCVRRAAESRQFTLGRSWRD